MTMIKPDEVVAAKRAVIDPVVEKCVDFLVAQRWDGYKSVITQKALIAKIKEVKNLTDNQWGVYNNWLFETKQLDFEDIYRAAGWKVKWDKPAYNEVYGAYWEFTK